MSRFFLYLICTLLFASLVTCHPAEAAVLRQGTAVPARPHALILDDPALADSDTVLDAALQRTLTGAGYDAALVTVDALRADNALAPERCALLVLPNARRLPAPLIPVVEAYTRRGGNLIVLGAPAWQSPTTVLQNGRWQSDTDAQNSRALSSPVTPFIDFRIGFPTDQLIRETNKDQVPTRMELVSTGADNEPGQEAGALHVAIPNLDGWDMWRTPDLRSSPFGAGETVTTFSARGGPRTRRLVVEWDERDGARWMAVVPLTEKWQRYALTTSDFHGWGVSAEREKVGFHPENVIRFKAGLAFTHTGTVGGAHEYWLAGVGSERVSTEVVGKPVEPPVLETIAPAYKFSPLSGPMLRLSTPPMATPLVAPARWDAINPAALKLLSSPPRATGAGFGKGRSWRWQPLLIARDAATGQWRGAPATLLIHKPNDPASAGGVWASFALGDSAFYREEVAQKLIAQIAGRIRAGIFLIDGGADAYTVLPGQSVHLGGTLANLSTAKHTVTVQVTVTLPGAKPGTPPLWNRTWELTPDAHTAIATPAAEWAPPPGKFPAGGYLVTAELRNGATVIDCVQHQLYRWDPPSEPRFVSTGGDGHFHLGGKVWRACGINYTPSSGIAQEVGDLYQRWMDPAAYDPESVERDLFHIEELGFNAVSAWTYGGEGTWQNLLDFLRRCRAHNLKVSLMLAPVVESVPAADALHPLIEKFRLPENDTLLAYEIAWEPEFNGHDARLVMDSDWEKWLKAHHGSVESAERVWGARVPRTADGKVTNPPDDMLSQPDGKPKALVADYRAFLDSWLVEHYGTVAKRLHEFDPMHKVSFRMSYAGDPTARGRTPYQFEGLGRAVDYLAPEAYGRVGDWEHVKPGIFTVAYARGVAPGKPVVWAESGMSIWDTTIGAVDPELQTAQGQFYNDFFRMAIASGSDGIFFWWYPGGYRYGEASDYGVLNPDGTDRPAAVAVRRNAANFKNGAVLLSPDIWFTFNRDDHPDGIVGIYDALSSQFWEAVAAGKHPGLRPAQ